MVNTNKKPKFRKTPPVILPLTEEIFIKKADVNQEVAKDKDIKTFLLRMPNDTKRKLKKIAYLTEDNISKICLKAIEHYIEHNFKDIKI